jgi:hypothetical protein
MVTLMLSGHVITPEKAFTTLTFMSLVRKSALEYFAYSVKYVADCTVTLSRIRKFLLVEEEVGLNCSSVESKLICTCTNKVSKTKLDREANKTKLLKRGVQGPCHIHGGLVKVNYRPNARKQNGVKLQLNDKMNILDNDSEVRRSLLGCEEKNTSEKEAVQLPKRLNYDSKIILTNLTCDINSNKNTKDKKDTT